MQKQRKRSQRNEHADVTENLFKVFSTFQMTWNLMCEHSKSFSFSFSLALNLVLQATAAQPFSSYVCVECSENGNNKTKMSIIWIKWTFFKTDSCLEVIENKQPKNAWTHDKRTAEKKITAKLGRTWIFKTFSFIKFSCPISFVIFFSFWLLHSNCSTGTSTRTKARNYAGWMFFAQSFSPFLSLSPALALLL